MLALQQEKEREALRHLQAAMRIGSHPLVEESLAWPQMFAWGKERGLYLPLAHTQQCKAPVWLRAAGVRELRIGERSVPLGGTAGAFDLLVCLALEGPQHWEGVGQALWEAEAPAVLYSRIKATLSRARNLLADREAVRMERGILSLDLTREWIVDTTGPGKFLEGLWTEWALEKRELN